MMMMRANRGIRAPRPARLAKSHPLEQGHAMTAHEHSTSPRSDDIGPVFLLAHPGYRLRTDGVLESDLLQGSKARTRTGVWHPIKPSINKRWRYAYVDLRTGKRRNARLNVLMMEVFVGPPPPGQEVRHRDGNRLNNRLENLSYGTRRDNMRDAIEHGTIWRGGSRKKVQA